MKTLLLIAALAAAAHAATVKGTVREIPGNGPIAGVQVNLGQEDTASATRYTGNDGSYEFRDVKPGAYTVAVAKAGYWWSDGGSYMLETGGLNVMVDADGSTVTRDLQMARPAVLRGRVVDEDGNPVAGLDIDLRSSTGGISPQGGTTDAEGRFAFRKLIGNSYVLRTGPRSVMMMPLVDFAEGDIGKVDEDYPVSYWPGGSTDPAAAPPVVVPPGGDIDIGDLRPRKVPLYRTLVRLLDEACEGNVSLKLSQPTGYFAGGYAANFSMPCASAYLFTGLTAGGWRLWLTKESRWAMAEINAGPDARVADVRLQDAVTITGKVVAGEGVKLPDALQAYVSLSPVTTGPSSVSAEATEGRFTVGGLAGVPYRVGAGFETLPYYAAEFRYGGRPVLDGVITPVSGGELEVVIDDQRGAISGTYSGGDGGPVSVLIFRERVGDSGPPVIAVDGRFTSPNLVPRDYQVIAIQGPYQGQALSRGQTVTVRRGETTNVSLRVQ